MHAPTTVAPLSAESFYSWRSWIACADAPSRRRRGSGRVADDILLRTLDDGRELWLQELTFGRARLCVGRDVARSLEYDDLW